MNKKEIENFVYGDIGKLEPATNLNIEPVNFYQKEAVEHLVDQLIKLNQEQNRGNGTYGGVTYKEDIREAMKTINHALKGMLTTQLILK